MQHAVLHLACVPAALVIALRFQRWRALARRAIQCFYTFSVSILLEYQREAIPFLYPTQLPLVV